MAQILTSHVYDDCEAIIEKFGCACITLSDRIGNGIFSNGSITLSADEMLEEGFSKSFIENFEAIVSGCRVYFSDSVSSIPTFNRQVSGPSSNPINVTDVARFVFVDSMQPAVLRVFQLSKNTAVSTGRVTFTFEQTRNQ